MSGAEEESSSQHGSLEAIAEFPTLLPFKLLFAAFLSLMNVLLAPLSSFKPVREKQVLSSKDSESHLVSIKVPIVSLMELRRCNVRFDALDVAEDF